MRIQHSNNLIKDILDSKNLTEKDLDVADIEYVVPNIQDLDTFLAFNHEIVIFADCDTDGLCAAAICKVYFSTFEGYTVHYKIASRDRRGFQLEDVKEIIETYPNATGILTVDCGITSVDAVRLANFHSLDVLITDHHEPKVELPECKIINPKLDSRNVFKDFCGAGLIYLCFRQLERDNTEALQYAAIATVADVVTLLKDNRWIVKNGLRLLNDPMRVSKTIQQFTNKTKLNIRTARDIGWGLGPLINSASRLNRESVAMQAFVHGDVKSMEELSEINASRKTLISEIMDKAENIQLTAYTASIYADTNYVGVLGLLAIKLYGMFGLPSIAYCQTEDGLYHYSVRGEGAIDFLGSLVNEHIEGGGHDAAAGFSTKTDGRTICLHFEWFYGRLYNQQKSASSGKSDAGFDRNTDGHIQGSIGSTKTIAIPLDRIVARLSAKSRLEPFGRGFDDPIFYSDNIRIKSGGRTTSGKYDKYWIYDQHGTEVVCYDFGAIIKPTDLERMISIEYNITNSSFNNKPVIEVLKVYEGGG